MTLALFTTKGQISVPDTIPTSKGKLIIHPVQHASLVLSFNGKTIYVDPVGGAKIYKGLAAPDLILITDIHGDHFDIPTIESLKKPGTLLIVPQAVANLLPAQDKTKLLILKNGDQTQQSGIIIKAIPMYNLPESPTAFHTKGRGNGYVLNTGGKNIYLSGDTGGIPEMKALKNIEVAFVCMNLPYTMDIHQAADAVLSFKPKIVYPYHYRGTNGYSDVKAFKQLVNAGNTKIEVRLRNWYPFPQK
jgi:L-ascorbate metabolism protein UlaG (beta-lactamase superfamily)